MSNVHIILINEIAFPELFLYEDRTPLLYFPIWSNFNISDILQIQNIGSASYTLFNLKEGETEKQFLEFLNKREIGENIILGRTGNIVWLDWYAFIARLKGLVGITKIRVDKTPSDLYYIKKKDLVNILKKGSKNHTENFLKYLFNNLLFNNLEKFLDVRGFSFFFRDVNEYYKSNLKILSYLKDEEFIDNYKKLSPVVSSKAVISENALVKDSMVGNGAVIEGRVENSVISRDVFIKKNAFIKDSVILPSNTIEEGSSIFRALLLKGSGRSGEKRIIACDEQDIINGDYPYIVKNGLKIILGSLNISKNSRIKLGKI